MAREGTEERKVGANLSSGTHSKAVRPLLFCSPKRIRWDVGQAITDALAVPRSHLCESGLERDFRVLLVNLLRDAAKAVPTSKLRLATVGVHHVIQLVSRKGLCLALSMSMICKSSGSSS